MPKVTVFMPVYNTEKYIKRSIESILNQRFKDFELLIIDDGSTDNSVNIIRSFKDSRIRLIQNSGNKGLPYTRNEGLKYSMGKYIAIMDSDDIAYINRLEEQVKVLEDNEKISVVTSNERVFYKRVPIKTVKRNTDERFLRLLLIFENCIGNTTVMFKKECLNGLIYNSNYFVCQDYKFWVDLSKYNNFTSVNKVLMKYRTGHNNITKRSKQNKLEDRNKLISEIRKLAFSINSIDIDNKDLSYLNSFLDTNDKTLKKFDDINLIMLKIIKQKPNDKILKEVIKYVILNQILICNGEFSDKRKLLMKLELETDIKFGKLDIIRIFKRNIYNYIRNYNA